MKFGVCGDLARAEIAARASYDFMEWTVASLLKPQESEADFLAGLETIRSAALPYPVANCFVPGKLKITGPEADKSALTEYVSIVMKRAEQAGVKTIVFGSGGARRIPEGFDPGAAHDQIVEFCRMVGPQARAHGVTVVVEPLNKADCNVLITVGECARLVREVAHPNIRLLVDAYHMMRDGDSYEDVTRHGELLAHVHVATTLNRLAPGAEPCDLSHFFAALAEANYNGTVSIEGKIENPEQDLPAAIALMRELAHMEKSG